MRRRNLLAAAAASTLAAALPALARQGQPAIHVFKSAYCECCSAWVEHLRQAGFAVDVTIVDDTTEARKRLGMPDTFGSCHTGSVAGYVLEGHVPAADIKRLLATRPDAIGLAVPGMPVGSPGMEVGTRRDPYDVLLIGKNGRSTVFATYSKR